MNESSDRLLVEWLFEGPERGPVTGLERALAATHRTPQRPGWAIPERWFRMQLTMRPAGIPRPMILLVAVALLALALAGVVMFAGARHVTVPAFGPAGNGVIVSGVGTELWLANADGSAPHKLDIGLGQSVSPLFSPDGTKFAFMTRPGAATPYSLFVANADGTGARSLTGDMRVLTMELAGLTWSPDGTTLAFQSSDRGVDRIYRVAADGTGLRAITDDVSNRASPAWSPDGAKILYQVADGHRAVYLAVMNPDGSGEQKLASVNEAGASFLGSQWTNDGRIAYGRSDGIGKSVVGIVGFDGKERLLSRPGEIAGGPQVSPDGHRVAYQLPEGMAIVEIGDPSMRTEIPAALTECGAAWSPDGTALLGLGANCQELYRIPVNDPSAARRIDVPVASVNNVSWQRVPAR